MGILVSYPIAVKKMPAQSILMVVSRRLIWLSVPVRSNYGLQVLVAEA